MIGRPGRVLALAPHTDDIELGAGGSVARWVEEGVQVVYVAFSTAEMSVPPGFPRDVLEQEVRESTKVLGIKQKDLMVHKFGVREFPRVRQDILELMVRLRNDLEPDLVLMPSLQDVHQDHRTVAEEAVRAFRGSNILAYELPWNVASFDPRLFVALEERHMERKWRALSCYSSQKHRPYMDEELHRGQARVRGTQAGTRYAEGFEVVRWTLK